MRKVNDDCQPICPTPVIDPKNIYLRNKNYPRKKTVEIEKCYFCFLSDILEILKSKKSLLAHFFYLKGIIFHLDDAKLAEF